MSYITEESKLKGKEGELAFSTWLNAQGMAHMIVDQTFVSLPRAWKGKIKRPDFLIGIPGTGLLTVDVKRKAYHQGLFRLDLEELEKFERFAFLFHLSLYFVNLQENGEGHWFGARQFRGSIPEVRRDKDTVTVKVNEGCPFTVEENFHEVFGRVLRQLSEKY